MLVYCVQMYVGGGGGRRGEPGEKGIKRNFSIQCTRAEETIFYEQPRGIEIGLSKKKVWIFLNNSLANGAKEIASSNRGFEGFNNRDSTEHNNW